MESPISVDQYVSSVSCGIHKGPFLFLLVQHLFIFPTLSPAHLFHLTDFPKASASDMFHEQLKSNLEEIFRFFLLLYITRFCFCEVNLFKKERYYYYGYGNCYFLTWGCE